MLYAYVNLFPRGWSARIVHIMMESLTNRSISETYMGDLHSLNRSTIGNSHSTHTAQERYTDLRSQPYSCGLTKDTTSGATGRRSFPQIHLRSEKWILCHLPSTVVGHEGRLLR